MGYWGTGPFENDSAGDWFDKHVRFPVVHALDPTMRRSRGVGPDEERAAAGVLVAMAKHFGVDDFTRAIEKLENVLEEEEWTPPFRKAIKKDIAALRAARRHAR